MYLQFMKVLLALALLCMSLQIQARSYFQQQIVTKIDVRLDDQKHFLHGFEEINYRNQSPDTLHFIYLHLWPNAYSSNQTYFAKQQLKNQNRKFHFSKKSERGYIDSLELRVDGDLVPLQSEKGYPDIAKVRLSRPLLPGGTIRISTPFRVKIPNVFSRMGHVNEAYYISQWFPKPAVYDTDGWHPLPYSDQGEFYSEVGRYDVSITVPKNYVVLATGNCLDSAENRWMDSLARNPRRFIVPVDVDYQIWKDSLDEFPESSAEWKTLHFQEDRIHDFAWFADKRYMLKKDTVTVPALGADSAHLVEIYCAFLPSDETYWEKSADYVRRTISYLSSEVGPYPYNTVKVVEGQVKAGGGMEYPTVTLIDRIASINSVMQTIVHEVAHNWFYGILANNERDYPWMDEGITTFYERKISREIRTPVDLEDTYTNRLEDLLYFNAAATRNDAALNNNSSAFTRSNYGVDVYYKAARMLQWLEGWMGSEDFRAGMQDYYQTWKFRHPRPEDFQRSMTARSSKSIDWFFDGALKTARGVDFAMKRPKNSNSGNELRVKNASDFAAPVIIEGYRDGVRIDSLWLPPVSRDTQISVSDLQSTVWRPGKAVPDFYGQNDVYRQTAFLNGRKVSLKFGMPLRRSESVNISVLPAIGFNVYDRVVAGAILHNLSVPQQRFRFATMPLYAFGSKAFVGAASVAYWLYPNKLFKEIVPQLDLKSFHFDSSSLNIPEPIRSRYIKVAPSLSFEFLNLKHPTADIRRLMLKGYSIVEDQIRTGTIPGDTLKRAMDGGRSNSSFALIRYQQIGDQHLNPYRFTADLQFGPGFGKASLEGKYSIPFDVENRSVFLRGFAGRFFETGSGSVDPRYWLASSYSGANDYLYDGTYFGRNTTEGFVSRQVSIQEGGGRLPAEYAGFPDNRSSDWLFALNVKADIPHLPLPLRIYADVSTAANGQADHSVFLYSAGFEIHAVKDILLLHIPVVMSKDYHDYLDNLYPGQVFWNSISFSLQLQNINWLRSVTTAMQYYLK